MADLKQTMERKYGVIKDKETAIKFLNVLAYYTATKDSAGNIIGYGAAEYLSDYLDEAIRTDAANRMRETHTNEIVADDAGQQVVLRELTKAMSGEYIASDVCMRLCENIFLMVRPKGENVPVTRMFIRHITTGATGDPVTTTFELGQQNSNNAAPAIAYEVTIAGATDKLKQFGMNLLVKLAWCTENTMGSPENLKAAMSAVSINCYKVVSDNNGADIVNSGTVKHSELVFGASSLCGGFLLHAMADPSTAGSNYGITVFNTDATPIYTWCKMSKSYTVVTDGVPTYVNRHNSRVFEGKDPPFKMAVFAPIACPAFTGKAENAWWVQQAPHDYSYFDNSGHVVMTKSPDNSNSVFYMDHGVALYDGALSQFLSSGMWIPGYSPSNEVVIVYPDIPDKIPYATDFSGYFDAEDGVKSGAWLSANDPLSMTLVGSPTLMTDEDNGKKCVRFLLNNGVHSYGQMPFKVDCDKNAAGETEYANNLQTVLLVAGRLEYSGSWKVNNNLMFETAVAGLFAEMENVRHSDLGGPFSPFAGPWHDGSNPGATYDCFTGTTNSSAAWGWFSDYWPTGMRYVLAITIPRNGGAESAVTFAVYLENGTTITSGSGSEGKGRLSPNNSYNQNGYLALNAISLQGGNCVKAVRLRDYGYAPFAINSYWNNDCNVDVANDIYFAAVGNHIDKSHLSAQINALKAKYFVSNS